MSGDEILAFVKASAALQGLVLDEARAGRVAAHLGRTAQLAQLLDDSPMAVHDEPAEIYEPRAFPLAQTGHDTP
ncbi:MAG: hypothetical protein JWP77_2077 [Polaromonas sp.]|jgi:hypothetical protein|nr:hypothetical protein [Polaromonas sp.]